MRSSLLIALSAFLYASSVIANNNLPPGHESSIEKKSHSGKYSKGIPLATYCMLYRSVLGGLTNSGVDDDPWAVGPAFSFGSRSTRGKEPSKR